jgi:hypothetical protein
VLRAAPGQPKRERKHHDTTGNMIATSSHVFFLLSLEGVVPKLSTPDACVCVCVFRCVRRCAVRCPPVAVSGHALRCVLVLVPKDQRKFKVGIRVPDPRLYTTKYNQDVPQFQPHLYYGGGLVSLARRARRRVIESRG